MDFSGMSPWSLPKATKLPQKVTAPTMPDATMETVIWVEKPEVAKILSIKAAPATKTDAAPPNPLNRATSCGIAVIGILSAIGIPTAVPTTSPPTISS